MKIYIRGGSPKNTSVKVLTHHLTEMGHKIVRDRHEPYDVMVCWGMSPQGLPGPALNAGVNQYDKFQAMLKFSRSGIPTPKAFPVDDAIRHYRDLPFPWLARKVHHQGGKDIKVVNGLGEARRVALQSNSDFFSVYIPTKTEFRVWIFQDKTIAVYEKVFKGDGEYEGIQRNHGFGFRFDKRDDLMEDEALTDYSVRAVKALGMDMGAVDVILGKDNEYYVLEVNSMPSIDSEKKLSGIRLAKRISNWAQEVAC